MLQTKKHNLIQGVSLVEVLVALVVISIGMLGIAALHIESLRSGRTAVLRSQAVILASDMADRIRANRSGMATYGAAATASDTNSVCEPGGAGGCTPAELAEHDKASWLGDVAAALPGGSATIGFDTTTNPDTYTITVSWTEQGGDQNYVLRVQA